MAGAGRFTLYGMTGSGNCEKVRIVAGRLGLDYVWLETALGEAGAQSEAFRRDVNPAGQVPAAVFEDGGRLSESGAIMLFLADGSDLIPGDPFTRAQMMQWMFWEQYSHEPCIAVRRAMLKYRGVPEADLDPGLKVRGDRALDRMEAALDGRDWFAGDALSLADIALYPYTRDAHEGGFDLSGRPGVRAWTDRVSRTLDRPDD